MGAGGPATRLPPDPLAGSGLQSFARRLRAGEVTAQATVEAYLARIAALEPRLQAFEHVAAERALAQAAALDRLLKSGTDLGPLMGVPVIVKDIIAVDGMPATAGSNVDVSDILGGEGPFIKRLKQCGCIILGKAKTVEFALGASHTWRGTPWNPCDATQHRCPGGSSSGSAVAVAAGFAPLAIGTDTGGSVRIPASFCGIFGLKTTVGLWPTTGVFPLAPSFDTIGLLTRTADDAAFAFAAIQGTPVPLPLHPGRLRIGDPRGHFVARIDADIAACYDRAIDAVGKAGAAIEPFAFPEAATVASTFPLTSPTELLAELGRERFLAIRDRLDPDVAARITMGLDVMADDYVRRIAQVKPLSATLHARMNGFDGLVSPTTLMAPPPMSSFANHDIEQAYHGRIAWNTRPGNVLGICATSLPIHHLGASLPAGLQVMHQGFGEHHALAVARTLQDLFGRPEPLDLGAFWSDATRH